MTSPKSGQPALVEAFRQLTGWLYEQGAPSLADGLAPGAKPLQLTRLEQKLGWPLPAELRMLWLLHDGQLRAKDGLIGALQLLPVSWVLNERPATAKLLARLRVDAQALKRARLLPAEVESDQWLAVAKRGDESMVVSAATGRVFAASGAGLTPVARTVSAWLLEYVDDVLSGAYEVVHDAEGSFLARRP